MSRFQLFLLLLYFIPSFFPSIPVHSIRWSSNTHKLSPGTQHIVSPTFSPPVIHPIFCSLDACTKYACRINWIANLVHVPTLYADKTFHCSTTFPSCSCSFQTRLHFSNHPDFPLFPVILSQSHETEEKEDNPCVTTKNVSVSLISCFSRFV